MAFEQPSARKAARVPRLTIAAGVCCSLLGLTVMVGWHVGAMRLIAVSASYRPMSYGAATGFLLVGLGLVSLSFQWRRTASVLAAAVFPIMAAAVIGPAVGRDFSLEYLLQLRNPGVDPRVLGRVPPNAILSFLLAAFALQALAARRPRQAAVAWLGCLVAAVGLTSLVGYATRFEAAYAWRGLPAMAIHGSAAFGAIGIALVYHVWKQGVHPTRVPEWLPVPVGVTTGTASLVLFQALLQDDRIGLAVLTLTAGCSLAAVLAIAVRFAQEARRGRERAERAGQALAAEIRERRIAEEALRRSEEQLRGAALAAEIGTWHWTPGTNQVIVAANWRRLFGVNDDAVATFETWRDALHPEDREHVVRELNAAAEEHREFNVEYRVARPDGTVRWIVDRGRAWYDESGRPTRMAGVNVDITERKRAEEALRESEVFYRQTLESIPGMVFTTRPDGFCDYQSQQWVAYTGVPMADHLGDGWNKLLHPADRTRAFAAWRDAVEGRAPYDLEYRVRRYDGAYEWFKVIGRPILDPAGHIVRWFGVALNIEALKRAEEALAVADQRKDEFIAVLSHELRNPLAPIRYALPLLEREPLGEVAAEAVAIVDRQVRHLTRMVDDLLDISRITRGKIELHREYVTVDHIVTAAVEAASPGIAAARHNLKVVVPEESLWVHGDSARLAQVVTNLLNNSARYTPRGGEIELQAARDDGHAVIRVRDSGMGIPPEALSMVFDMFRQVNRKDTPQGGLGIGLALAKRLVEMHGGTIQAHSDGVGRGAEFLVRLPVAHAVLPRDVSGLIAKPSGARRLKVLIVDDNVDFAETLALAVTAFGHDVRKALDGESAVSVAISFAPDVVLLDLGLPVMSGIEVARELRRHPETMTARLVAITGWGQAEDRRVTTEAGFDHHLTKPTDPQEVAWLLAEYANKLPI